MLERIIILLQEWFYTDEWPTSVTLPNCILLPIVMMWINFIIKFDVVIKSYLPLYNSHTALHYTCDTYIYPLHPTFTCRVEHTLPCTRQVLTFTTIYVALVDFYNKQI